MAWKKSSHGDAGWDDREVMRNRDRHGEPDQHRSRPQDRPSRYPEEPRGNVPDQKCIALVIDGSDTASEFNRQRFGVAATAIEACRIGARSDHIWVRATVFSQITWSWLPWGKPPIIREIHDFIPLHEVDLDSYEKQRMGGLTPLRDACNESLDHMSRFARAQLCNNASATAIIITDCRENFSWSSEDSVRESHKAAFRNGRLRSLTSILINLDPRNGDDARRFCKNTGMTHYLEPQQITTRRLADLIHS